MVQIVDMTTEEQLDMYMKCSKKEICKMLIEANRHLKRFQVKLTPSQMALEVITGLMRKNPAYCIRLCYNNTGEIIGPNGTYDIFNDLEECIQLFQGTERMLESSAGTGYSPPNVTDKYCGSGMCVEQCEKCEEAVKTTQIKTQRLITKSKKI